jgi:two-component system sensor histidine kinase YesM
MKEGWANILHSLKKLSTHFSLKVKMIFSFSLIILIVFGMMGYLTFRIYLNLFENEISAQYSKANEQALARLELRILDIYRISNYIVFHPDVEDTIMQANAAFGNSAYERYLIQGKLSELLSQVRMDAPQLIALTLYDLEGESYFIDNGSAFEAYRSEEKFERLFDQLQDTTGELIWSTKSITSPVEESGFRKVLIASRWMKNSIQEKYGILSMVFDESLISRELQELNRDETGKVYLNDQRDQLLYTDDHAPYPYSAGVHNIDEIPYLFVQNRSDQTSFSLTSRVSMEDIRKKSKIIVNITLYLGILSILLTAALVAYNSRRLLIPLKILEQGMRELRQGNFSARIQLATRDELEFIGQNFNSMAEHINSLIKEVYVRQLNEREAELRALQAQLNPHFLYNAMDMIHWKVYLVDRDTAKIVVSLTEMLRYVLEPVNKMVTLRNELQQIRNYLHIQTERFADDLQTVIEADSDIQECRMIRFLLQPLVENIFVHAFRDKLSDKQIHIRAFRIGDSLRIRIADNGCGMNAKTIAYVLGKKEMNDDQRQGLGIQSVVRRIDLIIGSPYGIEIESQVGLGTVVYLTLPLQTSDAER